MAQYDVDEVKLTSEINPVLANLGSKNPGATVYAIANQVSDDVTFLGFDKKDFDALKPAIEVARVVKDEFEVAMIRKANHISGLAHQACVQRCTTASNEQQIEATFLEKCVSNGAKEMAYHPIMASGRAAATLHYVANNAPMQGKQNMLLDAGAEWNNYASDIVSAAYPETQGDVTNGLKDADLPSERQVHKGVACHLRYRAQDAEGYYGYSQSWHRVGRRPPSGPQDCH
jgi:Xaa-Pro dipeptidase